MDFDFSALTNLSDAELLARVDQLARHERNLTADLVAHLMELDNRRLYCGEGCSSLFTYCTQVLHLSEHAAYNRIVAARLSRRFPLVLQRLADCSIHLTTVRLLAPCLTPENHRQLIEKVTHKSKEQVAEIVAWLRPRLPAASVIRRLNARPKASGSGATGMSLDIPVSGLERADPGFDQLPISSGNKAPVVSNQQAAHAVPPGSSVPLAPDLYKLQLTTTADTHRKLRQAQELLRHRIPRSDPARVIDLALTVLLLKLTRRKFAFTTRPRATRLPPSTPPALASRHIPASVRREVWRRDRGRCAFASHNGRRCIERGPLEFHHRIPHALGGQATADNIELRCRSHNVHESELLFGRYESRGTRG